MIKIRLIGMVGMGMMLVACNLGVGEIPASPTPTPIPTAISLATPSFPTVEPYTGPYGDAVPLVSGVCFEYLSTLDGMIWAWTAPDALNAFYAQVDAAGICTGPVTRWPFDFSGQVLVGAVNTAIGCDAAHHYLDLSQDDVAKTVTLQLQFEILTGCDYELVQPFLIAIPRPPAGYTINVLVE